jgi:hypothetical protein
VNPIAAQANTTVIITISGSGFQSNALVAFENGQGPAPAVVTTQVQNANTITVTVNIPDPGSAGTQVWDVRVINPDQSTAVLIDAFTVTDG